MSTIGELVQRDGKACAICDRDGRLFGNTDQLLVVISGHSLNPASEHRHVAAHIGCVEARDQGEG